MSIPKELTVEKQSSKGKNAMLLRANKSVELAEALMRYPIQVKTNTVYQYAEGKVTVFSSGKSSADKQFCYNYQKRLRDGRILHVSLVCDGESFGKPADQLEIVVHPSRENSISFNALELGADILKEREPDCIKVFYGMNSWIKVSQRSGDGEITDVTKAFLVGGAQKLDPDNELVTHGIQGVKVLYDKLVEETLKVVRGELDNITIKLEG